MKVIRLFDGPEVLNALSNDTLQILHATSVVPAIKKLITVHDILEMSLTIQKVSNIDPPWDFGALLELSRTRRELVVYHRSDFCPVWQFDNFSSKLQRMLKLVAISYERNELMTL